MRDMDGVDPALRERLALAVRIAREAGELTLEHFGSDALRVERKSDDSPVTVADRGAEELLRERIGADFPEDGILGEEFPETEGESAYRWILDPIDGTRSFVHGVPLYGTLVGIEREGRPAAGVIRIPPLEESVYAARGGGAWHVRGDADPVPARVSDRDRLADALFLTTDTESWERRDAADAYREIARRSRLARTWGDCYGYLLVATGRTEVMVDPVMSLWDAAALLPILEEAGGRFTDWTGETAADGGDGLATNGRLHREVLTVLGAVRDAPAPPPP